MLAEFEKKLEKILNEILIICEGAKRLCHQVKCTVLPQKMFEKNLQNKMFYSGANHN